ncbi:hypothetical protein [Microvirga sp. TS319]|uniref:hypothetical protein n=1 Tax=Microvirga sp. TS319 TaxID=3241165 RepID=UPI00351A4D38
MEGGAHFLAGCRPDGAECFGASEPCVGLPPQGRRVESLLEEAQHDDGAMELIRSLVEEIGLTPREEGGLVAISHSDRVAISRLCSTRAEDTMPICAVRLGGSKYDEAPDARGMQGLLYRHLEFGCGDRI